MNAHSLLNLARNRGLYKAIGTASQSAYASSETAYYSSYNKVRGTLLLKRLSGGESLVSSPKEVLPIAFNNSNTVQKSSYL